MLGLQLGISGSLKDYVQDVLEVDKFFFDGSFLSVKAYKEFPKEWYKLIAFLEKVKPIPWVL